MSQIPSAIGKAFNLTNSDYEEVWIPQLQELIQTDGTILLFWTGSCARRNSGIGSPSCGMPIIPSPSIASIGDAWPRPR
jgi:hypothetical protein